MLSLKADKGKVLPEVKLRVGGGGGGEERWADEEIGFTGDLVLKVVEAMNKETIRTTLLAQSSL